MKSTTKIKSKRTKLQIKDLEWAVDSRHKNQQCALDLYKLLEKYEEKKGWGTKDSFIARSLVGVVFSLWRAAFLADKIDGTKQASREMATAFLGKVIQDNAINFPQDREHREWTFDYYIENAYLRLKFLRTEYAWLSTSDLEELSGKTDSMQHWKHQWDVAHKTLSMAIENFRKRLERQMVEQ